MTPERLARARARFRTTVPVGLARLRARRPADPVAIARGLSTVADALEPRVRIACIVFSKDRPIQLDACLRSIEQWAPYDGPITVIYKASTPTFAAGYELLETARRVRLVPQSDDLRRDVIDAVDERLLLTVFHTDDDLFFRAPPGAPLVPDGFAAFSLRLGENTTHHYPAGREQPLPAFTRHGPVVAWSWPRATGDFGYPLSLNGHVMRTELLIRMLSRIRFTSPNRLEGELHVLRWLVPAPMLAFDRSCIVSVPVNTVNTSTRPNRAGTDPALSAETLNRRMLDGERINLAAIDFSDIRGAHQELSLEFVRSARPIDTGT